MASAIVQKATGRTVLDYLRPRLFEPYTTSRPVGEGMGLGLAISRKILLDHGGDLPGFHSQISFLPNERIGVIVFVIGDHVAPLYNPISYNVYERLLGMDLTPWTDRFLDIRLKGKKAGAEARKQDCHDDDGDPDAERGER